MLPHYRHFEGVIDPVSFTISINYKELVRSKHPVHASAGKNELNISWWGETVRNEHN